MREFRPALDPTEVTTVAWDFGPRLRDGESLAGASTVFAVVSSGTTPTPPADGPKAALPAVDDTAIVQPVTGATATAGTRYRIRFVATTNQGRTLVEAATLLCKERE